MAVDTTSGNLAIKKFNPKTMHDHCVILMVAKRRSGKSELVKDLLYFKRHMSACIAMSGTESGNGFYGTFLPPLFVYNEFDAAALQRIVDRQRRLTKEGKAQAVGIVLDDCGYDKKTLNSKIMRELLFNGRHYKITLFICAQYVLDLSPGLRANIDYCFALKENVYREKLFKNFFPMCGNLATFNAIMDVVTKDYGCLVLDNSSNSSKLEDCIFWYRANVNRPPFRIGHPSYWGFSRVRCREDDVDEEGEDVSSRKGASQGIVVKKVR